MFLLFSFWRTYRKHQIKNDRSFHILTGCRVFIVTVFLYCSLGQVSETFTCLNKGTWNVQKCLWDACDVKTCSAFSLFISAQLMDCRGNSLLEESRSRGRKLQKLFFVSTWDKRVCWSEGHALHSVSSLRKNKRRRKRTTKNLQRFELE